MCRTEATSVQRFGRKGHNDRARAAWRRVRRSADASISKVIVNKEATDKLEGGSSVVSTDSGDTLSSSSCSLSGMEQSAECTDQQDQQVQQFEAKSLDQRGIDELVAALSSTYTALQAVQQESALVTRFHSVCAPSMTIEAYLARLFKYFQCSDACLITSLMYIDRLVKLHPTFVVCSRNIHRLLAVSMVLAAKFNDDVYYSNKYYAKVCGLTLKELNVLESDFVDLANWKLDVSSTEYNEYLERVLSASRKF